MLHLLRVQCAIMLKLNNMKGKKHNFKTFVKPKRIHNNVGMLEMYLNVQFCEFHSKWPQMLFPLLKLITFKGREKIVVLHRG